MDGRVLTFDATQLTRPGSAAPTVPAQPIGSFAVGRNPVAFAETGPLSTAPDDLFVVSRGDRSITFAFPDGRIQGVLRDSRLLDPVYATVSIDNAGFGGSGAGRAVYTTHITVADYEGKALTNYAVHPRRGDSPSSELYPFATPNGPAVFLYGFKQVTPGKPFMINALEVI
jgi:hypothetical protein